MAHASLCLVLLSTGTIPWMAPPDFIILFAYSYYDFYLCYLLTWHRLFISIFNIFVNICGWLSSNYTTSSRKTRLESSVSCVTLVFREMSTTLSGWSVVLHKICNLRIKYVTNAWGRIYPHVNVSIGKYGLETLLCYVFFRKHPVRYNITAKPSKNGTGILSVKNIYQEWDGNLK